MLSRLSTEVQEDAHSGDYILLQSGSMYAKGEINLDHGKLTGEEADGKCMLPSRTIRDCCAHVCSLPTPIG
jgi:hypothetical protein